MDSLMVLILAKLKFFIKFGYIFTYSLKNVKAELTDIKINLLTTIITSTSYLLASTGDLLLTFRQWHIENAV